MAVANNTTRLLLSGPGQAMQQYDTGALERDNTRMMLGTTATGRDWSISALHPCGNQLSPGLPDTISAAVATPDYRGEYEISYDTTMWATAPTTAGSWGIQVVNPPIPEIASIYRLHDSSGQGWSGWRVLRTPGFELPSGTYTGATIGKTLATMGYSKWRAINRGTTYELDASALNDQGRITSGQLSFLVREEDFANVTVNAAGTTGNRIAGSDTDVKVVKLIVPDSPEFLVANCPGVYQEKAKHGAYVVHKFDTPLNGYQFSTTGDPSSFAHTDHGISGATASSVTQTNTRVSGSRTALTVHATDTDVDDEDDPDTFVSGSNSVPYNPAGTPSLPAPFGYNYGQLHPFISSPSGMQTSVTFIMGLPKTNPSNLRVKTRQGFECMSKGGAAISPFIHPAPTRDEIALDRVAAIMQKMNDAYPEKCNMFGGIMEIVRTFLPGAVRTAVDAGVKAGYDNKVVKTLMGYQRQLALKAIGLGSAGGGNAGRVAITGGGSSGTALVPVRPKYDIEEPD